MKNRWLSCDFRQSGCSTERCREALPTPSHTSCGNRQEGLHTHWHGLEMLLICRCPDNNVLFLGFFLSSSIDPSYADWRHVVYHLMYMKQLFSKVEEYIFKGLSDSSRGSVGTAGRPLITELVVWSPTPPVYMLKYPWARHLTSKCSRWSSQQLSATDVCNLVIVIFNCNLLKYTFLIIIIIITEIF